MAFLELFVVVVCCCPGQTDHQENTWVQKQVQCLGEDGHNHSYYIQGVPDHVRCVKNHSVERAKLLFVLG